MCKLYSPTTWTRVKWQIIELQIRLKHKKTLTDRTEHGKVKKRVEFIEVTLHLFLKERIRSKNKEKWTFSEKSFLGKRNRRSVKKNHSYQKLRNWVRLHLGAFSGQWHGFSRNKLALFVQRHVKWGLLWRVWQRSSSTITMGHFLLLENALFKYFRHTYHHCHAKAHGWNAYFVVNTIELWPTSTLCLHYTKLRITKEKKQTS